MGVLRTMDSVSAERTAIYGGRSTALEQALRTVAETDLGAGPKYSAQVVRDLSRIIASRAYGRPLLELMHLIRIADAAGGRAGWPALLFAVPVARGAGFRGAIQKAAAGRRGFDGDFALAEDGVEIAYPDGAFRVTYGRMGFLAALLEFAVTVLGWQAVDGVLRRWLADRFLLRSAGPHANALSRLLYDHLKEHLPTMQALRSYRRLTRFMAARRGGDFSLADLDDAAVLAFWRSDGDTDSDGEQAEPRCEEAGGARTFRASVEQVARLRAAMRAGAERRAMQRAAPLGGDRAAGEIEPGALLQVLEAHDGPADPLRQLASDPAAAVKFLTGRETGALDLIASLGIEAPAMPLSVLRAETFGAAQARLTQAVRRRAGAAEVALLASLADCESYEQRLRYWDKLDGQLRRLSLAALAVLLEAGRTEAACELLAHAPDADLSGLRHLVDTGDPGDGAGQGASAGPSMAGLLKALGDRSLAGARAAAIVAEARAALRTVTRRGFGTDERQQAVEGFACGAPAVRAARSMLERVLRAVDDALPAAERPDRFESDRPLFAGRLAELYGATP